MEYVFKIFELACEGVPQFLVVTTLISIIFGLIASAIREIAVVVIAGRRNNSESCHKKEFDERKFEEDE